MNIKKNILLRIYITFFLFVVLAVAIFFQIIKIQVFEGKEWRKMADSLTTSFETIEPIRGNIYSADNKLLVTSLPIYELRIDFQTLAWTDQQIYSEKIDSLCWKLAVYFKDKSASQYKKMFVKARREDERYFLFKRNLNHHQLNTIKTFPIFSMGRYKSGLVVVENSKRIYPFDLLAKRTIGFKNAYISGVGLEGAYNDFLSGQTGKRLMQKISGGKWIPINYDNEIDPEDGKDIITTIDLKLQDITETALMRALVRHNAESGCAIVMEVSTGKIKAIANLKKEGEDTYLESYNYGVGLATEPGSTIKLASAIILLENNCYGLNDIIDTKHGKLQFYDRVMRDSDTNGYGKISFLQAFEKSSNVAFSKMVYDCFSKNPKKYVDALKNLKFVNPLDLQIPGEGIPVVFEPGSENWDGTTLPWMSVGYALKVTPLQLLTLYNAVANNGKMVKPLFVSEVSKTGKIYKKFETEVISEQICSERTLEQVKILLKSVVESPEGTAHNIKSEHYQIAGKTGTSLIAMQDGYGKDKRKAYQASFAGYFPADNPRYSCIVVISNPRNAIYYGAWVAAPVFAEIADNLYLDNIKEYFPPVKSNEFNYDQMPIVRAAFKSELFNLSRILRIEMKAETTGSDWVSVTPEKGKLILNAKTVNNKLIPDVTGMSLSDAVYMLESLGFRVISEGVGRVRQQSQRPGSRVIPNSLIKITLS
jgi:cell division protein FtsI (penicillin-binding protein 3)